MRGAQRTVEEMNCNPLSTRFNFLFENYPIVRSLSPTESELEPTCIMFTLLVLRGCRTIGLCQNKISETRRFAYVNATFKNALDKNSFQINIEVFPNSNQNSFSYITVVRFFGKGYKSIF